MTNISDPNATEMRGWVMLMLERAAETVNPSECNDPAVLLACSLGSDSCPAACKDNEPVVDEEGNPVVVKSGDLSISATAAEGRKVILNGSTSDLDTITLKASEAITLNSVTLERFGYSSAADIDSVWLEDAMGNKITNERSLSSSKDSVTLNVKKEYRELESNDTITIVVKTTTFAGTYSAATAGTNMGFKVTAVDSSAKNLDIANYDAYLYDMVTYNGNNVNVDMKGKDKTYNYAPDSAFEVAKLKVTATNAAINVKGFTLTNELSTTATTPVAVMDLDKFIDNVIVSVDGSEVKGLKYSLKRDELRVTFDDYEIAINKNAQFVVEVVLKDFDRYGEAITLKLKDTSDLDVQEVKTSARAKVIPTAAATNGYQYTFEGGEMKLTNTKLNSTIDAARGSSDVVIGEGEITVSEAIKLANTFTITPVIAGHDGLSYTTPVTPANQGVVSIKMKIGGDEFEADKNGVFKDVIIEKSGKVQFLVELEDLEAIDNGTITFYTDAPTNSTSVVDHTAMAPKYDESNKAVKAADFAGSIQLSKIKVQPSKGSLDNTVTKDVEFLTAETSAKTPVFEGTYTAKKGDVELKTFKISTSLTPADYAKLSSSDRITFYLSIDGKEVSSIKVTKADFVADNATLPTKYDLAEDKDFANIAIKNGEKVSVKLEAEVFAVAASAGFAHKFNLALEGEDKDGATAGTADRDTAKIKFVDKGSVTVADDVATVKDTVLVKDSGLTLAKFIVKPSKGNSSVKFEGMKMTIGTLATTTPVDDFEVKVGDHDVDVDSFNGTLVIDGESIDIPSEGALVEVKYKDELAAGTYAITLTEVNGKPQSSTTFNKKIVDALVSVSRQTTDGDVTKYTFNIDKSDEKYTVKDLKFKIEGDAGSTSIIAGNISDGATEELANRSAVKYVEEIEYTVVNSDTVVTYSCHTAGYSTTDATPTASSICTKPATVVADNTAASACPAGSTPSTANTTDCIWPNQTAESDKNNETTITIKKVDYKDFFKVNDTYVKVNKVKD